MPKLFVSYRRHDSPDATGRLSEQLKAHFGQDDVFLDVDNIPYGIDFRSYLGDEVGKCEILLAIIGDHWLDACFEEGGPKKGQRRLDDPEDWLRIEIEAGLARGIPVVPILVGNAVMPSKSLLPDGLKELAYRNAATVRYQDFRSHSERLIQGLERLLAKKHQVREGVQEAVHLSDAHPGMALTGARNVLERVVREIYERRINEPAGTRTLEKLTQRLITNGCLPDRLAVASVVGRLDTAIGRPDKATTGEDVRQLLADVMQVVKWYIEVEQPDALGQVAALTPPPPLTPPASITVVPKGLRSFDASDAKFFLNLLPGAHDEDGLPESVAFWKRRIESRDESTFTVGLLYGPSGCGKSSLMKAGLLPLLADNVIPIYIEATPGETETRLVHGVRKHFPNLPTDLNLKATLALLRQGQEVRAGKKVLIVLDQFEQWLLAKQLDETTELVQALRQCDGENVQCIVMVRDDFWMAVTRFFHALEIALLEGQNSHAVDLFPLRHARQVLAAFGRAYGDLPREVEHCSVEQNQFLDQAIDGLAENGKIISVRLALFAEMMRERAWRPATLKQVGGAHGVGVTFLEETFSASSAPPERRYHQQAARRVLKALLPSVGSDLKGHMRSHDGLLEASGYAPRLKDFDELIAVLDHQLLLITPTDSEGAPSSEMSPGMTHAGQKFYQLTHDYLVPSLREWLTRKQRETRQGRAELRLADRSALWNSMPENRHLPSLWEYLSIQLLTNRKNWPESQRKMMRKAGRIHRIRFGAILTLFIILWMSGRMIYWRTEEERRATSAAFLVDQLISADIAQVPGIVSKLDGYRRWADPLLRKAYAREAQDSPEKLRLALALLPVDESKSAYLRDQLLVVTPDQFPTVRDALLGAVTIPTASEVRRMSASQLQKSQRLIQDLVPINIQSRILSLWEMALDPKLPTEQRFQAACALAAYTPYGDVRWTQINTLMARHLVSRQASDFVTWRSFLRPAKTQLFEPLASICRDKDQPRQARLYATETLADYASDDPNILFNLLADAEAFQFPVLFGKLIIHRQEAVALARQELAKPLGDNANEDEREALAQRQANAAVSLYRMGEYELVWPLLKYSPDPRVRSYIIHWLGLLGGDPQANIERLDREPDVTIRRALVLMLGEFNDTQLPVTERQPLIERLLAVYENEPDAGLHGVAEWLLRKWGQDNRLNAVVEQVKNTEEQLQDRKPDDKKQWYINSQEQTFVIVDPGEFLMGSPASEKGHNGSEVQHRQRISRRYAISAHEVTRLQFRAFAKGKDVINENSEISRTDDSPQVVLTWYDATRYCNWLSEQEGIPSEERFYVPNENQRYGPGMKINERGLDVRGYRLPTEAEWECACRAGTVTIRYYGAMELLLPIYAWYGANGQDRAWPVGSLKPNDLGLFDTLGNVDEWCNERYGPIYPFPDKEDLIKDGVSRVLRGGAFDRPPRDVRSSSRGFNQPGTRDVDIGFRPARTYP